MADELNECTVMVDGSGDWWIYNPKQDCWWCAEGDTVGAVTDSLAAFFAFELSAASSHTGFEGWRGVAKAFGISAWSPPPAEPVALAEWLLA